jgi:acyl-CoA synthetase (AMP-forming)/AMP-acid ligase II
VTVDPPPVVFEDRTWSAAEMAGLAASWRAPLEPHVSGQFAPIGLVMPPHPDTVGLLFALATFPVPIVLMAPDPRSWQSAPALPTGMTVVVPRAARDLLSVHATLGLRLVDAPEPDRQARPVNALGQFAQTPGMVFLTSGSTGGPKPVYRTWTALLTQGRALNETIALRPGTGVLAVLPLAGAQGFVNSVVQAALVGAPLGLLPRTNHRTVLAAFASGRYDYVSATPFLASLLSRCRLPRAAPPAPSTVRIAGSRVPEAVARAFKKRFGVPLLPQYGTTEYGTITVASRDGSDRGTDSVGRPLAGVEIRLGDDPHEPAPSGTPGRIWVRSPWRMEGYGVPPTVMPRRDQTGWSPTEDRGVLSSTGELRLIGRLDECFKASSGHLVNPDGVAEALTRHPAVVEAIVVPLVSPRGILIGALVETSGNLGSDDIRRHASRWLPPWAQPQIVDVTDASPRLPGGKVDRRTSILHLESLL